MSGWAECPRCHGSGEIGLYVNPETGKWETTDCTLCRGIGEVTSDVAADYLFDVGADHVR